MREKFCVVRNLLPVESSMPLVSSTSLGSGTTHSDAELSLAMLQLLLQRMALVFRSDDSFRANKTERQKQSFDDSTDHMRHDTDRRSCAL
jgi:hypothetical protein